MSGGILGVFNDADRFLRGVDRVSRDVERVSDSTARARGAVEGHDGVRDEAHFRREARGSRARAEVNWTAVGVIESREALTTAAGSGGDDHQPAGGRGNAVGQGQSNTSAGQQFVDALVAANNGNAEARDAAVRLAGQFRGADGRVHLPVGSYNLPDNRNGRPSPLTFDANDNFASPEEAVTRISEYLANTSRIGTVVTGLAPAGAATVPVGVSAPAAPAAAPVVPDPAVGATTTATGDHAAAPAGAPAGAPAAGATQQERNKQAQVLLERLGLTTGTRNSAAFNANNSSQNPESLMDGIVGPKTKAALVELGIDPNQPITAETLVLIQQKSAERIAAENTRNGQPAAVTTTPVTTPAAPDAARMATAVTTLTNLAGADKVVSAEELAAVTAANKSVIGLAFNLNNDRRVDNAELTAVVAAAQAQGITVTGGAAALNPLFAGVTFGAPAVVGDQAVQPVAARSGPPPISSELAGAPEGGFSPGRTPPGNPVLLAAASTGRANG